jgi:hypothetical protein
MPAKINSVWPTFRGPNYYVPLLKLTADVSEDGEVRVEFGTPIALNATGILAAQSIAVAGNTSTFAAAYSPAAMGRYGRNVTVVASGAATSTVTVRGFDYLGQPLVETLTLNGTTAVLGVKAFVEVTNVAFGATAATTINVGWGNSLGLPYRAALNTNFGERVSLVAPGTAGTIVVGAPLATVQTAITADPRGLYQPHSSVLPDGVRTYDLRYYADGDSLHGARHFTN